MTSWRDTLTDQLIDLQSKVNNLERRLENLEDTTTFEDYSNAGFPLGQPLGQPLGPLGPLAHNAEAGGPPGLGQQQQHQLMVARAGPALPVQRGLPPPGVQPRQPTPEVVDPPGILCKYWKNQCSPECEALTGLTSFDVCHTQHHNHQSGITM